MDDPLPLICPNCSAVFVITDYVPDGATLYMSCLVCRRKLRISPVGVEMADMPEEKNQHGRSSA